MLVIHHFYFHFLPKPAFKCCYCDIFLLSNQLPFTVPVSRWRLVEYLLYWLLLVVGWFSVLAKVLELKIDSKSSKYWIWKFTADQYQYFCCKKKCRGVSSRIEWGKWRLRQAYFFIIISTAAIRICRAVALKSRSESPPGAWTFALGRSAEIAIDFIHL